MKGRFLFCRVPKNDQLVELFGARGGRIVNHLANAADGTGQQRCFDVPALRETLVNVAASSGGKFSVQQVAESAFSCRVHGIGRCQIDNFSEAVLAAVHGESEEGGQRIAFAVDELVGGRRLSLGVT